VTTTTGAAATVVGKPASPMFEAAAEAAGAQKPLVVGDRLDTDVAGAAAMAWDSLFVLTGAGRPADLLTAPDLPTYVGPDVSFVLADAPPGRFRPATPEDAESLGRLLAAAGLSSKDLDERIGRTLVCEVGDREPGGLAATACIEHAGGFGILRSVAVRQDLRGLGLGMLAVAWAVRAGRSAGLSRFSLFTETAAGFFAGLGFRAMDRPNLPEAVRASSQAVEECAASATAMVLDLPAT
jgi:N-acetylglutamate synthase-like GNAT family acetyltransferase